jgi:hypothetical protein
MEMGVTDVDKRKVLELAKGLAKDERANADMLAGWNLVCDSIEPWALAQRPRLTRSEMYTVTEIAREAYLRSYVTTRNQSEAVSAALERVNIPMQAKPTETE